MPQGHSSRALSSPGSPFSAVSFKKKEYVHIDLIPTTIFVFTFSPGQSIMPSFRGCLHTQRTGAMCLLSPGTHGTTGHTDRQIIRGQGPGDMGEPSGSSGRQLGGTDIYGKFMWASPRTYRLAPKLRTGARYWNRATPPAGGLQVCSPRTREKTTSSPELMLQMCPLAISAALLLPLSRYY